MGKSLNPDYKKLSLASVENTLKLNKICQHNFYITIRSPLGKILEN